jgi:hypothetical protein
MIVTKRIVCHNTINWPADRTKLAVKAMVRLWAPIGESFAIGAEADAQFDGGEWSGPANSTREQEVYEALLTRVAERFGLTSQALDYAIQKKEYDEFDCMRAGALKSRARRLAARADAEANAVQARIAKWKTVAYAVFSIVAVLIIARMNWGLRVDCPDENGKTGTLLECPP